MGVGQWDDYRITEDVLQPHVSDGCVRVPIVIVNNVISEFRDGHMLTLDLKRRRRKWYEGYDFPWSVGQDTTRRRTFRARTPRAIFAKTFEGCAKHETTKVNVNHIRMILPGERENEGTYGEKFRIHFIPYDRPRAPTLFSMSVSLRLFQLSIFLSLFLSVSLWSSFTPAL